VHELIVGVVTPVSTQEVQVPAFSTSAAQFLGQAIHFFMSRVVVQALATPGRATQGSRQGFFYGSCGRWGKSKPFKKALWGSVTATLAIHALAIWSVAEGTLFVAVARTSALPTTAPSGFVVQLRHFEGSVGL